MADATVDAQGGGLGACPEDPKAIRDTRLVERALRESWPIPSHLRRPLIDRMCRIAEDPTASAREATSATRAILAASKINADLISVLIRASEHEDIQARLAALESAQ